MKPDDQYLQESDKTLWLLKSKSMVLPCYVMKVTKDGDGNEFFWFVWPAMEFREYALRWFNEAMKTIADMQVENYWRCSDPNKLTERLEKAEGVTPEWYYVDTEIDTPKTPQRVKGSASEKEIPKTINEQLIDELVERTAVTTKPTMKLILNALNQIVIEWLTVQRKPVNLGFATIVPVPYRENWQSALLRFFPNAATIFARPESEIGVYADEVGLMSAFLSKELLSIEREFNTCEWKLEIVANKLFTDANWMAETTRISQQGPHKYSDGIAYEIASARSVILGLFRRYVERSMRPFAEFRQMGGRDSRVLLPCTWGGKSHQKRLESAHSDIVHSVPVDWKKPRIKSLVEEAVRSLPDVSDVRQQTAELRVSRPDDE